MDSKGLVPVWHLIWDGTREDDEPKKPFFYMEGWYGNRSSNNIGEKRAKDRFRSHTKEWYDDP